MMRLAGFMGWTGVLAVVLASGCHKNETRYVFVGGAAPAPAPVVEAPAPAPVVEAAPAEPVPVAPAPAPVVVAPAPVVVAPAPAVSISVFHTHLGHHGHWVTVASYGQVWVPAGVAVGWQPYTVGHWVYTDAYGWMWASDEPWGWATYHYGRWVFVEPQGWVWVPGTVWGPAWVVWRSGGGYVGWAPMPPAVVVAEPRPSVELNINIGVNVVEHIHPQHWIFVREAQVLEPVQTHMVSVTNNITIIHQTKNVTNIVETHGRVVNRSISVRDVERVTGRPVRPLRVREVESDAPSRTMVKKDEVVIERPRLRAASTDAQPTGKPRGGTDAAAGQATRTRVQTTPPLTSESKVTVPTRSGRLSTSDEIKRTDGVTKAGTGATTVTSANSQAGKGDAAVRSKTGQKDSLMREKVTSNQGQSNKLSNAQSNASAPALDHYTQPFPPPAQPKVDPGPRRSKTLDDSVTKTGKLVPANPAPAEKVQGGDPRDRSQTVKRGSPTSRPSRNDSDSENVGARRGQTLVSRSIAVGDIAGRPGTEPWRPACISCLYGVSEGHHRNSLSHASSGPYR